MQTGIVLNVIFGKISKATGKLARVRDYRGLSEKVRLAVEPLDQLIDRNAHQVVDVLSDLLQRFQLDEPERNRVLEFLRLQSEKVLSGQLSWQAKARGRLNSIGREISSSHAPQPEADPVQVILVSIENNCEQLRNLVTLNARTMSGINFTIYRQRIQLLLEVMVALEMPTPERTQVYQRLCQLSRKFSNVKRLGLLVDPLERHPLEMQLQIAADAHFSTRTL